MKITRTILLIQIILGGFICEHINAQSNISNNILPKSILRFEIEPSATDSRITEADTPHAVMYNPKIEQGNLLLFIPGTNGIATKGPLDFFKTAIEQGYRVINISYINTPAIIQVCRNENLANCPECAEKFRHYRIYGDNEFSLVDDMPHDAIVNRLTKLLNYLVKYDKLGNWEMYLDENREPKWDKIALSGQSQGGGMSAYIAKRVLVARVISFSGGWDHANKTEIATWYFKPSITPADRWFGTYHIAEPRAKIIDETLRAMKVPLNHIYALDLPVPKNKKAHSNGIINTGYKELWIKMLGIGN